jgi:P27 family predicted phage terminase small subunit
VSGTSSSGGRNRKSRAAHALTGTGRTDRGTAATSTSADVPDPPKGRPPMPIGLIGPALEEWTRMVARLENSHTISVVDDAVLLPYCQLFAETDRISVQHRTNAALVTKLQKAIDKLTDGELIVRAIEAIVQLKKLEIKTTTQLRQGHMAVRQYLVELGMTPAARSRVEPSPDAAPANPLDRFTKPRG